ncbi:MAG: helix-turn-helix transcriptional regulator [Chloroflexi bacterium]|nr:helix-turn-helix transcriptional regulator [Chloroflexota bacterium]
MGRRTRIVVDDTPLASRIGGRIRAARLAAGLTQQQVAQGRYTKAYISSLEQGHAKPSMAALDFIAQRLGLPAASFLERDGRWDRMEADLQLASGRWAEAAEAYRQLLAETTERAARAEVLAGLAEALCRLERGHQALGVAAESIELFGALGRPGDVLTGRYWLAYARFQAGDATGARSLLLQVLDDLDAPDAHAPSDLRMRVLTALGWVASDQGAHAEAVDWLDRARALSDDLDDRRRAALLSMVATNRAALGDVEGAVRAGTESLALYRSVEARLEAAILENNLAVAWLQGGDLDRAAGYAASARQRHEAAGDQRSLAHVADTEARIALADGRPDEACQLATEAVTLARATTNDRALTNGLVTSAVALDTLGRRDEALDAYAAAVAILRGSGPASALRDALVAWADLLAREGRHREAFELSRDALRVDDPSLEAVRVSASA